MPLYCSIVEALGGGGGGAPYFNRGGAQGGGGAGAPSRSCIPKAVEEDGNRAALFKKSKPLPVLPKPPALKAKYGP